MPNSTVSFVATGDSFITRTSPPHPQWEQLTEFIKSHDVRFTNLETTIRDNEGFPAAQSGGTWASAHPQVLQHLQSYGFNVLSIANNHMLDYSYGGLAATEKYINELHLLYCGAGSTLHAASKPKYLETLQGRIAVIAVTSTFHESAIAGEDRADCTGRPGINPLRYDTVHQISHTHMASLKELAAATSINAEINIAMQHGHLLDQLPDSFFMFGEYDFVAVDDASQEGTLTTCNPIDLQRIYQSIHEAKRQADYVILSVHSHEMKEENEAEPADFLKEFCRGCIDEGAHAMICHGPHQIRGIEIYQERPIFYGLGNFIFQNETVEALPADFYHHLNLNHTHNIADLMDKKSKNGTSSFGADPKFWHSFIPSWTMENGQLVDLSIHPISLGHELPRYRRGCPVFNAQSSIIDQLNQLSASYHVYFDIQADGTARWQRS